MAKISIISFAAVVATASAGSLRGLSTDYEDRGLSVDYEDIYSQSAFMNDLKKYYGADWKTEAYYSDEEMAEHAAWHAAQDAAAATEPAPKRPTMPSMHIPSMHTGYEHEPKHKHEHDMHMPSKPSMHKEATDSPPTATEDTYVKASDVGNWGGGCTCPGGQVYEVGDNKNSCASLACIGGTSDGKCTHRSSNDAGAGMRVTCKGANLPDDPDDDDYPPTATEDTYVKASDVGNWGGGCTCPGGQVYEVGDNKNSCASLACIGGTSDGKCTHRSSNDAGAGMRVTCKGANLPDDDDDYYSGVTVQYESTPAG